MLSLWNIGVEYKNINLHSSLFFHYSVSSPGVYVVSLSLPNQFNSNMILTYSPNPPRPSCHKCSMLPFKIPSILQTSLTFWQISSAIHLYTKTHNTIQIIKKTMTLLCLSTIVSMLMFTKPKFTNNWIH